jgi:hypothetical protein
MSDEEREAKLPKWAQDELRRLRSDRDAARFAAANALGTTASSIEVSPHRRYDDTSPRRFVPDNTTIELTVKGGRFSINLEDDGLRIIGFRDDSAEMGVFPDGGNSVCMRFAK